jgi:hypothetical protein
MTRVGAFVFLRGDGGSKKYVITEFAEGSKKYVIPETATGRYPESSPMIKKILNQVQDDGFIFPRHSGKRRRRLSGIFSQA